MNPINMKIKLMMYSYLFIGLWMFTACSTHPINPLEYSKSKMTFGAGGGFSGAEHGFVLLDNGRMYALKRMGEEYTYLGRIDLNKSKQVFQNYEVFNFGDIELNDPGNMYKYIEYASGGAVHKITWGNNPVDEKLNIVHAVLMQHMKSLIEE